MSQIPKKMEHVIREWVRKATVRGRTNEYLELGDDIKVYARWTRRLNPFTGEYVQTMEIGAVEVPEEKRGQGIFTRFLLLWENIAAEQHRQVMVESVLNPRLGEMLTRRGYNKHDENWWRL